MRVSFVQLTTAAAIALGFAFTGPSNASAQSVMKQCGDQWQAAKQAGTTNGEDLAAVLEGMPRAP
jgi:hypothetical protein